MAFLIDEAHLPAILTVGPMTDEAFAQMCSEYPDLMFELSAEGDLIITPPNFTWMGARSGEITAQLCNWARRDRRGVAFDSSSSWILPSGARRSAGASWIFKHRIKDLDPAAFSWSGLRAPIS